MKKISLGLSCLLLSACSMKTTTEHFDRLSVRTYTANEAGFMANSHLIQGQREMILVDAQFTNSEAKEVAKLIRESGKKLNMIFITHEHPDHYFGLEVLHREFPRVPIYARENVISDIRKTSAGKLKFWKASYGSEMPKKVVLPRAYVSNIIRLERHLIKVIDFRSTESHSSAGLYIPEQGLLFSGDLVYNRVHLWLADAEGSLNHWRQALTRWKEYPRLKRIFPGHGAAGGPELLDADIEYINKFEAALKGSDPLFEMKQAYPNYSLPVILQLSVQAHQKK